MPKGNSRAGAQAQAGAAAVPTVDSPHPPDAAAFQRFVPAISQALQQFGVSPSLMQKILGSNERVWRACCSYDGSVQSRTAIHDHALEACGTILPGKEMLSGCFFVSAKA